MSNHGRRLQCSAQMFHTLFLQTNLSFLLLLEIFLFFVTTVTQGNKGLVHRVANSDSLVVTSTGSMTPCVAHRATNHWFVAVVFGNLPAKCMIRRRCNLHLSHGHPMNSAMRQLLQNAWFHGGSKSLTNGWTICPKRFFLGLQSLDNGFGRQFGFLGKVLLVRFLSICASLLSDAPNGWPPIVDSIGVVNGHTRGGLLGLEAG
mmetsp:Transcript_48641/g.72618  ORF Transcript_48641/g.72618 Transcript_48641/m.72618 type:complete len:203 (+) Transcript_48641:1631-2239(+)